MTNDHRDVAALANISVRQGVNQIAANVRSTKRRDVLGRLLRLVAGAAVAAGALTGCATSPSQVESGLGASQPAETGQPTPSPSQPSFEGERQIFRGFTSGISADVCQVTAVVPSGWEVGISGSIFRTGDEYGAHLCLVQNGLSEYFTLAGDADAMMQGTVFAQVDPWISNDGGNFITIGPRRAWIVTGMSNDPEVGQKWSALVETNNDVCSITLRATADTDDVDAQATLLSIIQSLELSGPVADGSLYGQDGRD